MRDVGRSLVLMLGLLAAVPAGAAPVVKRDVCLVAPTGGGSFNYFVLRGVETLNPGGAVSLRGLYWNATLKVAPLHGSAVMTSSGSVRIGLFVHATAESINDFALAGVTDPDFVGTWSYDNDGDYRPNGTLAVETRSCSTISVP